MPRRKKNPIKNAPHPTQPLKTPTPLLLRLLLLNLIHEIKIALIEMMHADISILPAARIAAAAGIDGDGVEGPKVALDAADLVLEDAVVEAGFELALARGGGGHVHGGLAAAEDHEGFVGRDGGGVEGGVGDVGF